MTRCVLVMLLIAALVLPGCGMLRVADNSGGTLQAVSLGGDPVAVVCKDDTSVYSDQLATDTSVYVSDLPVDQLISGDFQTGQVVHIEKLWQPKAGKTPLDSAATDISIRYVVFSKGEVGIYSGGGFATFKKHVTSSRITVRVLDASLQLDQSTPGFHDLLGPTQITGTITATLDRGNARKLHFLLSQRVTDMLGKSTLVDARVAPAVDAY